VLCNQNCGRASAKDPSKYWGNVTNPQMVNAGHKIMLRRWL